MLTYCRALFRESKVSILNTFQIRIKHHRFLPSYRKICTQGSDIKIPVPYGHLAAKTWGSKNGTPVLTFHGWLDNCGTFDRLMPLLPDSHYYVALDLPGHGLSSHRPPGSFYTFLDMILDLKRVIKYLGWEKFNIIGHSMGGEVALFWTGIFPQTVDKLVLLDIVKPFSHSIHKLPEFAQASIDENLNIENKLTKSTPVYSPENALKRLIEGMHNEITRESGLVLLQRGSMKSPNGDGLIYTRDLRVRTIELYNAMNHETARKFASNIKCDMLIVVSNNTGPHYKTPYPEEEKLIIDIYKQNCKKFVLEYVDGNHFVHLNNPSTIAPIVTTFLNS